MMQKFVKGILFLSILWSVQGLCSDLIEVDIIFPQMGMQENFLGLLQSTIAP